MCVFVMRWHCGSCKILEFIVVGCFLASRAALVYDCVVESGEGICISFSHGVFWLHSHWKYAFIGRGVVLFGCVWLA